MNTQSDNTPESTGVNDPSRSAPASGYSKSSMQPFHWSVRRELWENRSIYVAPLIVAVVVLLAASMDQVRLPPLGTVDEAFIVNPKPVVSHCS